MDAVVPMTVVRVLLFVLYVSIMRESERESEGPMVPAILVWCGWGECRA